MLESTPNYVKYSDFYLTLCKYNDMDTFRGYWVIDEPRVLVICLIKPLSLVHIAFFIQIVAVARLLYHYRSFQGFHSPSRSFQISIQFDYCLYNVRSI